MKMLDEFIFDNFNQAMNIHKKLFEIIRIKKYVTYKDLMDLLKIECDGDIYITHGWTNLMTCKIILDKDNDKWILKMPKIKYIVKEGDKNK